MCLPLIRAVQDGIEKRFGGMIKDPELIAAAILLPKFKTTWTERADIIEAGLVYVRQHLDQMAEAAVEQVGQHSSDEEDFFSSMKSRRSQDLEASVESQRSRLAIVVENNCPV
ncbi:zinc finger BED domain-containing 1-like protein [Labeo rohita]|uniref:Zinc finger BED domain-containing 1-like protein n=1 Tax=Labeo rohita TaxID=84645 RepID=A0A498P510_LABRO|nr:zinc finger BED domain-containing 1-like protein [Labeo rohita]